MEQKIIFISSVNPIHPYENSLNPLNLNYLNSMKSSKSYICCKSYTYMSTLIVYRLYINITVSTTDISMFVILFLVFFQSDSCLRVSILSNIRKLYNCRSSKDIG